MSTMTTSGLRSFRRYRVIDAVGCRHQRQFLQCLASWAVHISRSHRHQSNVPRRLTKQSLAPASKYTAAPDERQRMGSSSSSSEHRHADTERPALTKASSEASSTSPARAQPPPTTVLAKFKAMKSKVSASELKRLMREYGPVAVTFHASVFFATLGGFYGLIDYGLDVTSLVQGFPVIANNLPNPSAGNLAVAWGVTTLTGPFRGVMTVTLTPRVARLWWGREAQRQKMRQLRKARKKELRGEKERDDS